MITCQCPSAGSIPTLGTGTPCAENFGQIQKVAFQRLASTTGKKNKFPATGTGSIIEKASWTLLLTASDNTKIVVSSYIQAPTEDGGDAITFGGGNDTVGGVEIVVGRNPVNFSGVLRSLEQAEIARMKKLMCEAQAGNLGVYLFDENGNIEALKKGDGDLYPIPVHSLFIGDKIHGGLETPDSNVISWSYEPNYSDELEIVMPSFNPLTDLRF